MTEKRECLYCGRTIPKNRSSSWCSAKCVKRQERDDKESDEMEREIQDEGKDVDGAQSRMTNVEEVARATCLSHQGIWGGAWSDAWSPETLDAARAVKTPAGYLAVEGFTREPSIRFRYFIPWKFIPKGGHDVAIVNYGDAAA